MNKGARSYFDGDQLRILLGTRYGYSVNERLAITRVYETSMTIFIKSKYQCYNRLYWAFHEIQSWNRKHIKNYIAVFMKVSLEE